jgi:hypothetical protein
VKNKEISIPEAVAKLPKWAQEHIANLSKAKDNAVHHIAPFLVPPQPVPVPKDMGISEYVQHWDYNPHFDYSNSAKVNKVWRGAVSHRDSPPGSSSCGSQGSGRGFEKESDAALALYCEYASISADRLAKIWNRYQEAIQREQNGS